jgi:ketose-bisphosphate aldolase
MSLVNLKKILKDAKEGNYAVGAFNIYNIEDISAVIKAGEELRTPVILMTSISATEHSSLDELASIIRGRAEKASIPVCLHLDHASDYDIIINAIHAGYTSVMYDGSMLPYEENVQNTKDVLKVAKPLNVSVEAEIGRVGRTEEGEDDFDMALSVPEEVQEFVNETGVDACAIAIGSQHAMQKQEANLDFERLKEISELVDVPLVLHGSSGVVEKELKKVPKFGMQKVNIGTRLKRVFTDEMRRFLDENKDNHNHITVLEAASEAVTKEVIHKLKLLGCEGSV